MGERELAVLIFGVTYLLIISERLDRTVAALAGGVLMIVLRVLDQQQAFAAIDLNVIFLLAGMMIFANVLAKTGLFEWLAIRTAKLAKGRPLRLLLFMAVVTAALSALLDNVTAVVLVAPVVISLARTIGVSAVPFLIAQALASNIGGTATLIGDPPNILIGSAADLGFGAFLANMLPVSLLVFAAFVGIMALVYRGLTAAPGYAERVAALHETIEITEPRLLRLALPVLAATILGFLLHGLFHYEVATVALLGAVALLIVAREQPQAILRELEWSTLFFFIGLFMLVGGLVQSGFLTDLARWVTDATGSDPLVASMLILWLSALLSGVVDNIPYTATMIPVVHDLNQSLDHPTDVLWWSLALGADLGGNLTVIGASANVLVANLAAREGAKISFLEFFKYGALVTALSLVISSLYLWLRYLV